MEYSNSNDRRPAVIFADDETINTRLFLHLIDSKIFDASTASGGEDLLNLCQFKKYDLILIDHMMPNMDGIETLEKLRILPGPNRSTPCVCVTATSRDNPTEFYYKAGFEGYIQKPFSAGALNIYLKDFLSMSNSPEESYSDTTQEAQTLSAELSFMAGIDVNAALENCGGPDNLLGIIRTLVITSKEKREAITKALDDDDIKTYTVLVHALKNTARLIGAHGLYNDAQALEKAGERNDSNFISKHTTLLLNNFDMLSHAFEDRMRHLKNEKGLSDENKPLIAPEKLKDAYDSIYELVTADDFATAENIMLTLEEYRIPENELARFKEVRLSLAKIDRDKVRRLLE
ncbi:MAG: response regulator [Eubacterium sp.]|nr:response regulator [Eubacterium sp.]